MAHEVIKRVGARAYRYSVESFRDPESKKVRSRWTYVGRVHPLDNHANPVVGGANPFDKGAPIVARKRRDSSQTRDRLVDAFERLVERGPGTAVSAGMVAAEAGLAHGTFYRYFADKRAILVAALERVRDEIDHNRPTFAPPYGSRADERARVRAWAGAVSRHVPKHTGVLRAWLEALDADPALQAMRTERRRDRIASLGAYLEALAGLSIVSEISPEPLATALVTLIDAMFRESVAAGTADTALAEGIVETFDRSIFGVEPAAGIARSATGSATGKRPLSNEK